jgi:hypothetical protein
MATTTSPAHHPPTLPGRSWVPVVTVIAFCALLAATVYAVVRYGSSPRDQRPGAYEIIAADPAAPANGAPVLESDEEPVVMPAREPPPGPVVVEPDQGLAPRLGGSFAAPPAPAAPAALPDGGVGDAGSPDGGRSVAPNEDGGVPLTAGALSPVAPEDAGAEAGEPEPRVACGATQCAPGKICCNESCGICTNPGEKCSQLVCGMPVVPGSVNCGPNTCNVGQICCNASCGICVSPGETCDQRRCANEIQALESQTCGMQTCNAGFACCNPSCGTCTRPGEPCSQAPCT